MGLEILCLNLAPVRHEIHKNARAIATYKIGDEAPHQFMIWRTPSGDIVQAAPVADLGQPLAVRVGSPVFGLPSAIMQRVASDLLARYAMEYDDAAPFVPFGDAAAHPDNNTGWRQNAKTAKNATDPPMIGGQGGERAAKHRSETAAGSSDAAPVSTAAPAPSSKAQNEPPTEAQKQCLVSLGHKGAMPPTKAAATTLIDLLKNEKADRFHASVEGEAREKAAQPAMGF